MSEFTLSCLLKTIILPMWMADTHAHTERGKEKETECTVYINKWLQLAVSSNYWNLNRTTTTEMQVDQPHEKMQSTNIVKLRYKIENTQKTKWASERTKEKNHRMAKRCSNRLKGIVEIECGWNVRGKVKDNFSEHVLVSTAHTKKC